MLISIIIPVYNVEKYLKVCIDSILNQTYKDLEIILVNDGSTDNSKKICESYLLKDNRIILIDQLNSGPSKARNKGIEIAKGKYISFVDADDVIKLDYYQNLYNLANKTDVDIIMSEILYYNGITESKKHSIVPKDSVLNKHEIINKILIQFYGGDTTNIASLCNKLYKRELIQKYNLRIDETRVRAEDYWFNFIALLNANSFFATNYAGYIYNTSVFGSIMKSFRENQYQGFLRTRNELLTFNQKLKFEINYKKWDEDFINNANEYILLCIKNNRWDIVNTILKEPTFNNCWKSYIPLSLHIKLLKNTQYKNLYFLSKTIYRIWATRC